MRNDISLMSDQIIVEEANMRTVIAQNKHCKGQALVEMAILLPLLFLLVFGIFEFGRAMYIKNTLTHAARAGARAAVVTPNITAVNSITPASDCSSYGDNPIGNARVYKAVCTSLYSGIKKPDVGMTITINEIVPPTGLGPGDMVEVRVSLNNYHSKYRTIPFIPVPDILDGTAAMRYE